MAEVVSVRPSDRTGHRLTTPRSSPQPGLAQGSDRRVHPHNLGSSGREAFRPDAAALLTLQRGAGNRAVAQLMTAQREIKRLSPKPQPTVPAAAPAATATPAQPAPPVEAQPGEQQVVKLYPIFDRLNRRREMVTAEQYEQERAALGRLLRFLANAIPADAKAVLEAYPFVEIKDMYQEVTEALTTAGQRYAHGQLAATGFWAKEASQYTRIEPKAHERFLQEGTWSYVGKRVGLAVIGFFEGAAQAMVGLVDTGASLVGYHPDLEGWVAKRYTDIKDMASAGIGIDHNLVHDDEIGRFGGRLAGSLATPGAIGKLGKAGTVVNVTLAAAGAKSTIEAVVAMRAQGKPWSDIVSDPVTLAQFAGSLAGVAGAGGAVVPQLRSALGTAGLVLNAGQMAALTTALATYKDDPKLTEQQNFSRRADLLADVLSSAAFLGEDARARAARPEGAGGEPAPKPPGPEPVTGGAAKVPAGTGHDAWAPTKDGKHQVHVHDGQVEVCPVQRCVHARKVVEGNDEARNQLEQAEGQAGADPQQAAAKVAAALDDADKSGHRPRWNAVDATAPAPKAPAREPARSRARRREMIAEAAERQRAAAQPRSPTGRREMIAEAAERIAAAKRALRSMTDREIELFIAGFDEAATAGKPGTADLKRPPEQRADIANKPLTSKERKALDKKIAQMKAAGLLPPGYRYRPPKAAGAVVSAGRARKAMGVIGAKVTENPAVAACWKQAADAALGGRRLTRRNYAEAYKSAQARFWRLVARNEAAKRYFVDKGFTVPGSRSAYLDIGGVHGQEVSLGLDHTFPKATGDNYKLALDGDKLQFLMQADNTKLSHLEKKDPSLRRQGDDDDAAP
jgi:negative regulator of replication initiation